MALLVLPLLVLPWMVLLVCLALLMPPPHLSQEE